MVRMAWSGIPASGAATAAVGCGWGADNKTTSGSDRNCGVHYIGRHPLFFGPTNGIQLLAAVFMDAILVARPQ